MERALTVEQAAEYLQLSPYTVRQWLREGKLPGRKIGRAYRIMESDLEACLAGAAPTQPQMVREAQPSIGYASLDAAVMASSQVLQLIMRKREDILRIAQSHRASNVRLFGSVVRGDADEKSDIDFLVQFQPGTSLLQHAGMIADLEELLGRKVDVVPEKGLKEHLRERVLSEAVPL
jgi:uncharacterized protein